MSNESTHEFQDDHETPKPSNEPVTGPSAETTAEPPAAAAGPISEVAGESPEQATEKLPDAEPAEPVEDFANILMQFERSHTHKPASGIKQIEGIVISLSAEQVFLDIGYKVEGVLPRSAFPNNADGVKTGDKVPVSVKGRNEEGYYDLTRFKVAQPKDWTALEEAFKQKLAVVGTVTGVVKGGLTVDVGVRAFMPASRSGTHDAAELEQLVGTERLPCRITGKLDVTDEKDVVVDRRVVLEEQARAAQEGRLAVLQPGDVLDGAVRSLTPYGAFVDLGGFDGLLHVSDISWSRVNKPEDVLSAGQQLKVRILKIDPDTKKGFRSASNKLQPEPWDAAPSEKYQVGQRITGSVTRLSLTLAHSLKWSRASRGSFTFPEMTWGKKNSPSVGCF